MTFACHNAISLSCLTVNYEWHFALTYPAPVDMQLLLTKCNLLKEALEAKEAEGARGYSGHNIMSSAWGLSFLMMRVTEVPLSQYLLLRSSTGATHEDLVDSLANNMPFCARFFHMYPRGIGSQLREQNRPEDSDAAHQDPGSSQVRYGHNQRATAIR